MRIAIGVIVLTVLGIALLYFASSPDEPPLPVASPPVVAPAERVSTATVPRPQTAEPHAPTEQTPLGEDLNAWVELALGGDADAGFYLGRTLMDCKTMLRQINGQQGYAEVIRVITASARDPSEVEAFRQQYRTCNDNQSLIDSGIDWIVMAADAGHVDAKVWFEAAAQIYFEPATDEIRAWYRQRATDYLESARDSGSVDAMLNLSDRLTEVDPIASYAHFLLAERAIWQLPTNRRLAFEQSLAARSALASRLNDADRSTARASAARMFSHCCDPSSPSDP